MNDLVQLAKLIKEKNDVDQRISHIIDRPAIIGHVGEYIASKVFKIQLEQSASNKGLDGYFIEGKLTGKSVNIKWYTKRSGILDLNPDALPDYYLVLAGPHITANSSKGAALPWIIEEVFLFNSRDLVQKLDSKNIKIGVATSVAIEYWAEAKIYPNTDNSPLTLTNKQIKELFLFR
ncbi:MAG: hypothetical protein VB106_03080 [Clostridiaceae bacterium]|jgi:hypothetical protein|nr:hypothetical protein [Clostridiaceae bacterium]